MLIIICTKCFRVILLYIINCIIIDVKLFLFYLFIIIFLNFYFLERSINYIRIKRRLPRLLIRIWHEDVRIWHVDVFGLLVIMNLLLVGAESRLLFELHFAAFDVTLIWV